MNIHLKNQRGTANSVKIVGIIAVAMAAIALMFFVFTGWTPSPAQIEDSPQKSTRSSLGNDPFRHVVRVIAQVDYMLPGYSTRPGAEGPYSYVVESERGKLALAVFDKPIEPEVKFLIAPDTGYGKYTKLFSK